MSENGSGQRGQIFSGKSFWISQKVPSRTHYIKQIKEQGGTIRPFEKEGIDYCIADDLKDKKLVGNYVSFKFIDKSINAKTIVDPTPFRVGKAPRDGGNTSQADTTQATDDGNTTGTPKKKPARTVRSRVPFSKSDDFFLLTSLANNGSSANTAGNALYKEMARKEPHHTMHSWRSRWYEHLKNIVPEEDLWGDNPCYGDNAKRKPGPLAVTRMRVAQPDTDSEDGDTSRRSIQKRRQQARQQQNEEFEREALAQEEKEERRSAKKPVKSKFTLAEDNQLLMVHGIIPSLPEGKRAAVFQKLARKFPNHTAQEWEERYNRHIVPEANKAMLAFEDDDDLAGDYEDDTTHTEPKTQPGRRTPAANRKEPSPELGDDQPNDSVVNDSVMEDSNLNDSLVEDVDSIARAFGHSRKSSKSEERAKAERAHTPEKQIIHEVTKPPASPSGHGLKDIPEEEPAKLSTPQQPFSPPNNRNRLAGLRSSPNLSPSVQRRSRRPSTPQAQISSPRKKAPKSPKGHPVTSPPVPMADEQISLTNTTTTSTSNTTSVHQWLGDVEESDSQIAKAKAHKKVPAALLKYHKLTKGKKRTRDADESADTTASDQKRLRTDAAGTKAVKSTTPEAVPAQNTVPPATAQAVLQKTPEPVAPVANMGAPIAPMVVEPATPAPRRSGRGSRKPKEATPPPQTNDEDEVMSDSWVEVNKAEAAEADSEVTTEAVPASEPVPEPAPVKRGRGRPPKKAKPAAEPQAASAMIAPVQTRKAVPRDLKNVSTQDLYAMVDPMDQSGESLTIPVDQSTQRGNDTTMDLDPPKKGNDTTMSFEKIDEEDAMDTGELDEVEEVDEEVDEEQALQDYIKTVLGWMKKYQQPEGKVLEVIMMCSKVEDLIVKVLESLSKGKGIPKIPGVWSAEDDRELQSGSAQAIEKMAKKHGKENIDIRYDYLNSINTYNSSKRN